MTMYWIKSAGGPLVTIGRELAPLWRGISGNSSPLTATTEKIATDYSRACEIEDYVGIVNVSDGNAIILGDMPLATAFWTDNSSKIFIVRAFYMDPDEDVATLLAQVNDKELGREIESIDYTVSNENMVIFDSALPGKRFQDEFISIVVPTGHYRILTFEFKPNPRTSLLLHRFRPQITNEK